MSGVVDAVRRRRVPVQVVVAVVALAVGALAVGAFVVRAVTSSGSSPESSSRTEGAVTASERASVAVAPKPGVGELVAYREPDRGAGQVASFPVSTERPGRFLAVHGYRELQGRWDELSRSGSWVEVLLPVRPNGTTGWVSLDQVDLDQNLHEVVIDRQAFTLKAYRDGEVVVEAPIAVGRSGTETPAGTFYVTQLIEPPDPNGPYGPFAFALSGFSEDIFEFNGGPGVVGVHGTDDPAAIGGEVSFGCVRVTNDVITKLAGFVPLATPVRIR